jgi:hypothetical protein
VNAKYCLQSTSEEVYLFYFGCLVFLIWSLGGFLEFQATHPSLCKTQLCGTSTDGGYKCPPMTSMSQPCMPVSNVGPTKILAFLFLGSQQDALSQETMQVGTTIVLGSND